MRCPIALNYNLTRSPAPSVCETGLDPTAFDLIVTAVSPNRRWFALDFNAPTAQSRLAIGGYDGACHFPCATSD
jgi:hypothetical protein